MGREKEGRGGGELAKQENTHHMTIATEECTLSKSHKRVPAIGNRPTSPTSWWQTQSIGD